MAKDINGVEIPSFAEASAGLNQVAASQAAKTVVAQDGAQIPVDNEQDLSRAILSDSYSVNPDEVFNVKKYDGTIMQFPGKHIKQVLASGDYLLESKEETQNREDETKYGDKNIQAGVLGAARGLTFGLSDQALKGTGVYTGDELRGIENANPVSSIGGEVLGAVAPVLLSGGTSLAAKGATKLGAGVLASEQLGAAAAKSIASRVAEKQAVRAAALEAGEKLAASEAATVINVAEAATSAAKAGVSAVSDDVAAKSVGLFAKSLEKSGYAASQAKSIANKMLYGGLEHMAPEAANLAVQGALQGAGRLVTEEAFGTAEFNAENLVAYAGLGALVGGTFGATVGAGKALIPKASELISPITGKIKDKAGDVVDSFLGKEQAALGIMDMTDSALAKAIDKRPNFIKLGAEKVETILKKYSPKDNSQYLKAVGEELDVIGKKIGDFNDMVDGMLKEAARGDNTLVVKNPSELRADMVRSIDDMFAKSKLSTTAAEKNSVFNYSDELITNIEKELGKEGMTMNSLQKYITQFGEEAYKKGKTSFASAEDATRSSVLKRLRDVLQAEQLSLAESAAYRTGRNPAELVNIRKTLNQDYSVLKDMNFNSKKKLAAEAKSGGFNVIVDAKDAAAVLIDPLAGGVFKAARMAMDSFTVQKQLAMGSLEKSQRALGQAMTAGLNALSKGAAVTAKAAEPSIVRSLVSSQLAVKTVDGKKQKPKNEEEAYNNIIENANKAVTDPESVLQHSNRQTAAMFEHAPNTAAAVDAKYLQMMQFIASKTKKSSKNTGIFDIGKPYKPSGFEMAKIARYVDAISNPQNMLSKAAQGKLSREHVEVMSNLFPQMHNKLKEVTLKHISENKAEMKYAQKLQLGLLLGLQAHESMQPQNIQALQSQFNSADSETSGDASYNKGAVGEMTKSDTMGSNLEQHEIGD